MRFPTTEERVRWEIRSWLVDDQQLAELGRRCVTAMTRPLQTIDSSGGSDPAHLRSLLVDDWLRDL